VRTFEDFLECVRHLVGRDQPGDTNELLLNQYPEYLFLTGETRIIVGQSHGFLRVKEWLVLASLRENLGFDNFM
jgi:hypothetical protein